MNSKIGFTGDWTNFVSPDVTFLIGWALDIKSLTAERSTPNRCASDNHFLCFPSPPRQRGSKWFFLFSSAFAQTL